MIFGEIAERIHAFWLRLRFSGEAREDFYQQLTLLIDNGVKIDDAIRKIYEVELDGQSRRGKTTKPRGRALVYRDLMAGLAIGEKFSTVLRRWVGVQEASVIAAGEKSGELMQAFVRVAEAVRRRKMLIGACVKPLVLPVILLGGSCAILLFAGYGFAPKLLAMMPLEKWTGDTRQLLSWGLFFKVWWPVMLVALLVAVGAFWWSLGRWTGYLRAKVEHLGGLWTLLFPPVAGYSIYRIYQASLFLDNVAQMLSSGVKLDVALDLLGRYSSPWLRERITGAERGIGRGGRLGEALKSSGHNFPDKRTIAFLQVLESTDGVAEALEDFTARWVELNVKQIARNAVGIRLFTFVIVGAVILMFFAGIYGVSQVASAIQSGGMGM